MAEIDKAIGERIRLIRKSKRIGQIELSKRSGVSQGGISDIELGKREAYPSTLERMAAALDVPTSAFFADDTTGGHPPLPPRLPLTAEPEEDYNGRLAATDVESAEDLRDRTDAEFNTQQEYIEALKAAGVRDDDFRLKRARVRLKEAMRRSLAITSRATDLALNAQFGRDKPIYDTVEAYVGKAEAVDSFHGAQQKRHDSAERAEKAGKAG
jgi:HTH-type transcriptional regulator, repressor for puuD